MQKIYYLIVLVCFNVFANAQESLTIFSDLFNKKTVLETFGMASPETEAQVQIKTCAGLSSEELLNLVSSGDYVFTETQNSGSDSFTARPKQGGQVCQGKITASLFDFPEEIIENLNAVRVKCGQQPLQEPAEQKSPPVEGDWLNGCEVLAGGLTESEKESAKTCLASIKSKILAGTNNNRVQVFTNLYKHLNPAEQRFAAMIFTSVGESEVLVGRNGNIEEYLSVMKVLDNRKKYALGRGIDGASALGAALQDWQFSMYNRNEHRWKAVIVQKNMNTDSSISQAIDAYASFENANFEPDPGADEIYHYYSTILDPNLAPSWRHQGPLVNFKIDGVSLNGKGRVRHKFYKKVPWSYREPNFKRRAGK